MGNFIERIKGTNRQRHYPWMIALTALLVRLINLGTKSIYVDEAVTIYICSRPLGAILPFMMQIGEVHPPLYFWTVRLWMHLWPMFKPLAVSPEAFYRLTSVIFSTAGIYTAYILARRLFNTRVAILTGGFLALSTFNVFYSQELRMYPMLLFLMLGSFYFFLKSLEKPDALSLGPLILFNAAALLTHYYAVYLYLIELVFGVYVIYVTMRPPYTVDDKDEMNDDGDDFNFQKVLEKLRRDRGFRKNALVKTVSASVISLAPLLWWAGYFVKQTGHQDFSLRINPTIWSPFILFGRMAFGENFEFGQAWTRAFFIGAAVIPLFLIIYALIKRKGPGRVFAGTYLVVPLAVTFAVTFTRFHIFEYKYFFIICPALWMLASAGILCIKSRWARAVIITVIVGLNLFSLHNFHFKPYFQSQDWKKAASIVKSRMNKGDEVVVSPSMMSISFLFYFNDASKIMPMDHPDPVRLKSASNDGGGLWLVTTVNHPYVRQVGIVPYLKRNYREVLVLQINNHNPADVIRIYYFQPLQRENVDIRRRFKQD